jgi:hypothetical protein
VAFNWPGEHIIESEEDLIVRYVTTLAFNWPGEHIIESEEDLIVRYVTTLFKLQKPYRVEKDAKILQ